MRLGQLIKYNKRTIFLLKCTENEAGGLVPDVFYFQKSKR